MKRRFAELGIDIEIQTSEPPDHLSLEIEYLFLMLERAWIENAPRIEVAAREFVAGEMRPWLECFQAKLTGSEQAPFFTAAAGLLAAMLRTLESEQTSRWAKATPPVQSIDPGPALDT